jgi:hypothetical protein
MPTSLRVDIWHNTHAPHGVGAKTHIPFLSVACPECEFSHAYSYNVDDGPDAAADDLERIWTENQNIGYLDRPADHDTRSLSIGDLVQVGGHTFAVAATGWDEVDWFKSGIG